MGKFIITGGPCTGKSTLLESLAKEGHITIPESARELIDEERGKPKGILPWTDYAAFQKMVWTRQKAKENRLDESAVCFLDRGHPDNLAYCELGNVDLGDNFLDDVMAAGYEKVFILDRLPFYVKDPVRKEDEREAILIHEKICEVYHRLRFDIVHVPFLQNGSRKDYVLERIIKTK
jgi:predicted ATPase